MFATRIEVVDFDVDVVVVLAKCKTKTFVFVRSLVSFLSFSLSFVRSISLALFFRLFDFYSLAARLARRKAAW